jgi:DnaJ-class molecular chaperone
MTLPPVHKQRPQSNPPTPAEYNPKRWLNDNDFCIQGGRSIIQSLTILGLGFRASETEIKVHYQQLVCKYHPDKNDPAIAGLSASKASAFFRLMKNVHEYLIDCEYRQTLSVGRLIG